MVDKLVLGVSYYDQREFQEEGAEDCNDSLTLRSRTTTPRSFTPLSRNESTNTCCVLWRGDGTLQPGFIVLADMENRREWLGSGGCAAE